MILHFLGIERVALGINARSDHIGALIHVGEQERGAHTGLGVKPGAAIAVAARADLEIEGAVDTVLLRPENRGQVLRHCEDLVW